jgi:hypothetical protein
MNEKSVKRENLTLKGVFFTFDLNLVNRLYEIFVSAQYRHQMQKTIDLNYIICGQLKRQKSKIINTFKNYCILNRFRYMFGEHQNRPRLQ